MDAMGRAVGLKSYVTAFVLGFGSCALAARFLLPLPVDAASEPRFREADPAAIAAVAGESVVTIEAYNGSTAEPGWSLIPGLAPAAEPDSVASGVVLSSEGHIVTNAHVLNGATRVRVRLADDREFTAQVVGSDLHSDLAVLKIKASDLSRAMLGNSRRVRPGSPVVAIGTPLGFEHSVSVGVVSANRHGPLRVDGSVLGDMIQTDAAINQGNSGGGLFDAEGKLIGINTAILVARGGSGSIGIGFAIPVHRMRPVTDSLIRFGRVPRPWLGIRYELPPTSTLVRQVRHGAGVLVEEVIPDSPADEADLRAADVLHRIGDCDIRSADDIYSVLERYRPGTRVAAEVTRDGETRTVALTLGSLPSP